MNKTIGNVLKYFIQIVFIILVLSIIATNVFSSESSAGQPDTEITRSAEVLVAEMSDEQARRLLIESLKKEAAGDVVSLPEKGEMGKLAGFIESIKVKGAFFEERLDLLRSKGEKDSQKNSGFLNYFSSGKTDAKMIRWMFIISTVFAAGFVCELLFHWYRSQFNNRMTSAKSVSFRGKIIIRLISSGIDVLSTLIFISATILFFYLFYGQSEAPRILLTTYLTAIVAVRIVRILSRFFLSPKDHYSRFLPIDTQMAQYLYRWITAISLFASFGFLTCGIIRLAGANEVEHIKSLFMVSILIAGLLIIMILKMKREVADKLSANLPADSVLAKMAQKWHHFAVVFIFLLLIISMFNQLMGNSGSYVGIKTLMLIPLYFLADWFLNQILKVLFGFIPEIGDTHDSEKPEQRNTRISVEFSRMKETIVFCLRTSLAFIFIIWVLSIWGTELPIGKAVAHGIFNILTVVLLCYILWEFLNAKIQKRLSKEMPDEDEDMEEGGSGGSRIGTLLLLLRKFLMTFILVIATMVILSAMGIDIGPLIAGAGVIGLAIGFGAQTLVKDIISGIFFLIDDAFRVGDYIEIGTTKGVVEQISVRSFKLRHPRGMVNTIPFGNISTVTNYSRDYIISKLDFRVKYGTDVEKVRKIIKKKVYKEILKNDELAPKLLGKIKSQGVRQLEDSAMIMRVKFKTIPGEQFGIRKEVLRLLQEAFKVEGIEFAHRNVTVYIPPDGNHSSNDEVRKKHFTAGAAAAVASHHEQKGQA